MAQLGKLIHPSAILPLFATRRILLDSEIASIFSTSITILPAVPGFVIMPIFGQFSRQSGVAWTAGSFTGLNVKTGVNPQMSSFDTGVLTATPPFNSWLRAGATGVGLTQFSTSQANMDNAAVTIAGVGGNPSNGSGGLDFTMFYYLVPVRFAAISN